MNRDEANALAELAQLVKTQSDSIEQLVNELNRRAELVALARSLTPATLRALANLLEEACAHELGRRV